MFATFAHFPRFFLPFGLQKGRTAAIVILETMNLL